MCICVSAGAYGVQKRASDLLKLELQVVLSHPVCVLGTKLSSFAKAVHALH